MPCSVRAFLTSSSLKWRTIASIFLHGLLRKGSSHHVVVGSDGYQPPGWVTRSLPVSFNGGNSRACRGALSTVYHLPAGAALRPCRGSRRVKRQRERGGGQHPFPPAPNLSSHPRSQGDHRGYCTIPAPFPQGSPGNKTTGLLVEAAALGHSALAAAGKPSTSSCQSASGKSSRRPAHAKM